MEVSDSQPSTNSSIRLHTIHSLHRLGSVALRRTHHFIRDYHQGRSSNILIAGRCLWLYLGNHFDVVSLDARFGRIIARSQLVIVDTLADRITRHQPLHFLNIHFDRLRTDRTHRVHSVSLWRVIQRKHPTPRRGCSSRPIHHQRYGSACEWHHPRHSHLGNRLRIRQLTVECGRADCTHRISRVLSERRIRPCGNVRRWLSHLQMWILHRLVQRTGILTFNCRRKTPSPDQLRKTASHSKSHCLHFRPPNAKHSVRVH